MSDLLKRKAARPCGTPGCTLFDSHVGPCSSWEVSEPRKRGRLAIGQLKGQMKLAAVAKPKERPADPAPPRPAMPAPPPVTRLIPPKRPDPAPPPPPEEDDGLQDFSEGPGRRRAGRPVGTSSRGDPLEKLADYLGEPGADCETLRGWRAVTEERAAGATSGQRDCYYISPAGKRFRSRKEVARYLGIDVDEVGRMTARQLKRPTVPRPRSKGPSSGSSWRGYKWVRCHACDRWRRAKITSLPQEGDAPWYCSFKYHMRCAAPEEEASEAEEEPAQESAATARGGPRAAARAKGSVPGASDRAGGDGSYSGEDDGETARALLAAAEMAEDGDEAEAAAFAIAGGAGAGAGAGGAGCSGGLGGGGDATDAVDDANAAAANAVAASVPPCRCHGCRLTLCAAPDERAVRLVRLELLVHRTSRGRARMALHGEEGYRQRVGARVRVTG